MHRLPPEIQTLYTELIERLTAFEAQRTIGSLEGGFQTKRVKGTEYYYFQHYEPGGVRRQLYVGRRDPVLDEVVAHYEVARTRASAERHSIERLSSLLRAGGASTTDRPSARVIRALADARVFHLGGVLVGAHAFSVIGQGLGVRWDGRWMRTAGADISAPPIRVALPEGIADVPDTLDSLRMGFLPVPPLSRTAASTPFKVRGQRLRVDLLVLAGRHPEGATVAVPRFKAAARAMPFLDYLTETPMRAAVVDGRATLVNVPDPARYALLKLAVAATRPQTEHFERGKDLSQSAEVLGLLLDERPGDVSLAVESLRERRGLEQRVLRGAQGLRAIAPEVAERLAL